MDSREVIALKRINSKSRERLLRHAKFEFEKNIKRKDATYDEKKHLAVKKTKFLGYEVVKSPSRLSVYNVIEQDNDIFKETNDFISSITKTIKKSEKILIDFSDLFRVDAAALVMMYARTEIALKNSPTRKIMVKTPKTNRRVRIILQRSNLIKLLRGSEIVANFNDEMLPVISSADNDYLDDIVDYLMKSVYHKKMTADEEHTYSDAISETIHNVGLHAYPNHKTKKKSWWLLCQVVENQLFLAIYDNGVGIPKTIMKKPYFLETLYSLFPKITKEVNNLVPHSIGFKRKILKSVNDSLAISISMKGDVSRTKLDKHGQGSKSIRRLVDESEQGRLWVFSNEGLYYKEQKSEPILHSLVSSVRGTLVQWNLEI